MNWEMGIHDLEDENMKYSMLIGIVEYELIKPVTPL